MLDKLLSVFTSSSSSSILIHLACFIGGAYAGWYATSDHYTAEIQTIRSELAIQAQKESTEHATRLSKAISERDDALSRLGSSRNRIDSLSMQLLDADRRETARVKANPDKSYSAEYTTCRSLLRESMELLAEGCEQFGRCAADKDAIANIIK